ncbi:MAG: DUF1460 domain-containing protein [Candidatus Sericytochromatia bacterium]
MNKKIMLLKILFIFVFLLNTSFSYAKNDKLYNLDKNQINDLIYSIKNKSLDEKIKIISEKELTTNYKLDPLGEGSESKYDKEPIYDLKNVDCVTFTEQTLALALSSNFEDFINVLQKIRYKNGEIKMEKRNHYFIADWMINNNWLVEDFNKKITEKADYNEKLISHQKILGKYALKDLEPDRMVKVNYIPKTELNSIEDKLLSGDILVFIQKKNDIDASHVGIIIKEKGKTYFRNATSLAPKMVVDSEFSKTVDYIKNSQKHLGISILRLKNEKAIYDYLKK